MRRNILFVLISVLFLGSCAVSTKIADVKPQASTIYNNGDYAAALKTFESIIANNKANGKTSSGEVYACAGKSAFQLGMQEKALAFFTEAGWQEYKEAEMFKMQAEANHKIDNLSNEITALENYSTHFPDGADINQINERLLETYIESENWDLALNLWPSIDSSFRETKTLQEYYFNANKGLDNFDPANKAANKLIKMDSQNALALEWFAIKYYKKAEDLFTKENNAYKKKRTTKQYNILLKALDQVTNDFKKSLNYFERLYKVDPQTNYATYIGNIYGRFDDDVNSKKWHQKAKN